MTTATSTTLPPGPGGRFPFLGDALSYARDPLGFVTRCAREHGDVVRLRLPGPPAYLLNHPDLVERVLVTENRDYKKDRETRGDLGFLGDGLLTSDGEFWRRQRRLAQPAFHRRRVEGYGGVMVGYAERTLKGWRGGEARDVHADMMRLTLEIVAKTLVDADVGGGQAEEIGEAVGVVMDHSSEQGSNFLLRLLPEAVPTPGNVRFRRAIRRMDGIIQGIIDGRRRSAGGRADGGVGGGADGDAGDLLSMLLAARDGETGEGMSDKQLRDEVMTVVMAGQETTALALSWAFYLLGEHPKAEEELLAELDGVLGGRAPDVSDLPRLPYADAVVKEAMRLYPPAWGIGREALRDTEVGGYRVAAGTQLYMCQWVVHRDGRFFEEPETFRPGRWLDGSTEGLPRFAYFPFGGGPRLCIGSGLAKMEAVLVLATVARRFRLEPVPGRRPVPKPSITLRPDGGVAMVPRARGGL